MCLSREIVNLVNDAGPFDSRIVNPSEGYCE
jgi:hypothetical protein